MDTVNFWASRVPRAQFLYGLSTPLVLWIGGRQVIAGELPVGDLAKVVFYLMAIGHRVGMVGQFTNIIQNAGASAERVMEIIREPQTIHSGERPLPPGRGEVRFEKVSFHYNQLPLPATQKRGEGNLLNESASSPLPSPPSGEEREQKRPSLDDITFTAAPGQSIAIVGPTGSGKTTLVNLIPRFYEPTAGRVFVDGLDVREMRLAELRRSVGVIFQETFLFSASVAENIAYGRPGAKRAEIEECARAAQAHEFILILERVRASC